MSTHHVIRIATRGSALALAQARMVLAQCHQHFPELNFEIKIIKTTGDKRLAISLAHPDPSLPKGLFTKELEVALLDGGADLAVHSLKDLPTDLPAGLVLGAVSARADARDVLIYRDGGPFKERDPQSPTSPPPPAANPPLRGFPAGLSVRDLPDGAVVATSSTRRQAQLLENHPRLRVVEIRGNVHTRLEKLAGQSELDATILAAAGLQRLGFVVTADGYLHGESVPAGLRASFLATEVMLPCVGQAALGIEVRLSDDRITPICRRLNHYLTFQCTTAERSFLRSMGGGCQSPVAAYAEVQEQRLLLRAVSFRDGPARRAEVRGEVTEAEQLGRDIADRLEGTA